LLKKQEFMKVEINSLNQLLLTNLAKSQGNILEDRALLTSLDNTKAAALEISRALQDSVSVQADLDQRRNAFMAAAICGTRMFFALRGLPVLGPMYHFSMASFFKLFHKALVSSTKSADMTLRIASINSV
jgi:dynein heavy chain 2, cytosolic